jgi:Tfp pilus assembly protein PilN
MERRDRVRRIGVGLGIAGGVLFLAAALVQLLGARMELRSIRQHREDIQASVAPLLAGADSLLRMEDQVQAIEDVEADSEGWAFVLVELAVLLPEDTHLERIQAAGDTLVLEAVGGRAGEVLEALQRSATLTDPRLEGSIQRDVEDGEATGERFRLSAIRREDSAPSLPEAIEGEL